MSLPTERKGGERVRKMRMVCRECRRELKLEKSQVVVQEISPERKTFRLWYADLWGCPGCGVQVAADFGRHPFGDIERRDDLARMLEKEVKVYGRTIIESEVSPGGE